MDRELVLFLDDDPNRAALASQRLPNDERHVTVWCKNAAEAIGVLNDYAERLKKVYLDHDLEGMTYMKSSSPYSGMEIVRFLEKQNVSRYGNCKFVIHTHNEYAGLMMVKRLEKVGYDVRYHPFGT
jgi:CheY-like chemotaxis protein